jgi:ADP-heptose:LPS heptosyltransferase
VAGLAVPGAGAWAERVVPVEGAHQSQRCLALARALGGAVVPATPRLVPPPGRDMGLPRGTLVLHAGAASAAKAWPVRHFLALVRLLEARGHPVRALLGPEDGAARDLLAASGVALLEGRPLPQVAALLARASLVVGSDSGIAHLAAAVGTKVLVLFGPTDPARTAPLGPRVRVLTRHLPCSPCWAPRTRLACPTARECLEELAPEAVLEAVEGALGGREEA